MWQPRGNTVFVCKASPKTETDGGIILPTEQVGLTLEGEIITSLSPDYPVGSKVLFSKFAGSEVKVGGEALLIMQIDDILATWQESTYNPGR